MSKKENQTTKVEKVLESEVRKDIEVIPGNIDVLQVKLLASILNTLSEIKGLLKDGGSK